MQKEKWAALVQDDRPLRQRAAPACLLGLGISFTFVFFAVLDIYISNHTVFTFIMADFFGPLLFLSIAVFAVVAGALMLLRGRLFNIAASLALGLLLAGYLQGTFLNIHTGQLTGDAIPWQNYKWPAMFNLLLWVVLLCLPLVLHYFLPRLWRGLLVFLPLLIVGMQLVALIISLGGSGVLDERRPGRYLSTDGINEVSAQENVLVFILDRLDQEYVAQLMYEKPDFFDRMEGFTYYPNSTSLYCRTFPSVAQMLTGRLSFYKESEDAFFDAAWKESTFIPDLRSANYTTKIYTPQSSAYSNINQLEGYADNISDGDVLVERGPLLNRLMVLALYRYAPQAMKANFWLSTDIFDRLVHKSLDPPPYYNADHLFYQNLVEHGLTVQNRQNNFFFVHLNGPHSPYTINEKAEFVPEDQTSHDQQLRGSFEIVYEYMRQMQALGLYDNATIIITGDHPKSEDFFPLDRPKTTALFVKPSGVAAQAMQISEAPVSHANFQATVLDAQGLEYAAYGPSVFDIPEDADVTRYFYYRVNDEDYVSNARLEYYEVRGDARDWASWHKVGEEPLDYLIG